MEGKKTRRHFTPEQKFEILREIEKCPTLKEGIDRYQIHYNLYRKWKRQLAVGVQASLRNGRPIKGPDLKRLEVENRRLKEIVLNQSAIISDLKKEMNLD